jgi:hypothetical protein
MVSLAGLIVLAALVATPAPTRPALLPALYVAQAALQGLDAHSTLRALEHGGTREGNPLLRGVVGQPAALLAVKVAGVTSTILLAERLWKKGHRRTAVVTLLVVNSVTAVAVAHNYHVTHGR